MIKLFITDLDGCISMPFIPPKWEVISEIKALNELSKTDSSIPPLTICTGRPMPYAEAVYQWLGMYKPFLFESGGGIYDMSKNELYWHPTFDTNREQELNELKLHLRENFIDKYPKTIPEFAKFTDSGIINQEPKVIFEMYPLIKEYVGSNYPNFEVHYTNVSINVISKSTNKGAGIKYLCELLKLDLSEVAFIGDTGGDRPGLEIVGKPFAPKNALESAKKVSEVMEGEDADAVLEAYKKVIEFNRSENT
ncbi:MAG: HAD family phosphatase [Balneola sp.]